MRFCVFSFIVLTISLNPGSVARAELEVPVLLRGGTVIASPQADPQTADVLIRDGRIQAVAERIEPPVNARVLHCEGLTLYAGFVDAYTHRGMGDKAPTAKERARRESESPDVREGPVPGTLEAYRRLIQPQWRVEERFDADSAKREAARKVGVTASHVAPSVAIFAGQSALIQWGDQPLRESILRTEIAQNAALVSRRAGQSWRDAFRNPAYPTTIMGAMATFRQMMHDVDWHHDVVSWYERNPGGERPVFDGDLQILQAVRKAGQPVIFVANGENDIHRALNLAAEFHLRPIIAGGREAWRAADRLAEENVPVLLSLEWPDKPEQKPRKTKDTKDKSDTSDEDDPEEVKNPELEPIFPPDWETGPFEPRRQFDERVRLWEEKVDNALRLHEAGIRYAFASYELKSPADLLKRVRLLVERELPADVAIAALTTRPAEILGANDLLGTIEPDRLANLVVATGPIFDKKSKIKWVFVEGRRFEIDEDAKAPKDKSDDGDDLDPDRDEDDPTTTQVATTAEAEEDDDQATSKPTTAPADEVIDWPNFACEIEADREPRIQTGGNLLIRHANLLTVTNGVMEDTDLLIEDGRITAIGRGFQPTLGVQHIDLPGYYVVPGIIDCHSHICIDGGVNEFSFSTVPEVRIGDVIDHRDVSAYRALAGGVTMAHTMHGSANTIGGQNETMRLKYGRPAAEWPFERAPATVKFALGENVKQSNSSRRGTRFPNTRMGVEAVLHRAFDAAVEYKADWYQFHLQTEAEADPRPRRHDLRLEALAAIHDGNIWVHCHCYRADEILRLLAFSESYGFRIAVLQHILEGYRIIPEMRRHGCGASTFSDWWAYKLEAYDAIPYNAARMIQGGVVATVNSDSPEVIRHLPLEAAKAMRYGGLGAEDALRLVTINAAIQLGVDRYVGSIEVGKHADLAVFDAHPLDSFSKCMLTLIDGEVYFQHDELAFDDPPAPRPTVTLPGPRTTVPLAVEPADAYWLVGAVVHPVSGPPILDGAVGIADGRITYVGPADDGRPPQGARRIDVTGLEIYPGLINAGTQLGLVEVNSIAGSVDRGDIGTFQADLMGLSAYNPFAAAIGVARADGVTSALVVPGGPIIRGRAGLVHLEGWSMPEAQIDDDVAMCVDLPSLPARFPEQVDKEDQKKQKKEHREQLDEIARFFRDARHYAEVSRYRQDDPRIKPRLDRRLEAMIPYVRGEKPVLFTANSYKEVYEAILFAERFELRPIIYGGREAWKLIDELSVRNIDVIVLGAMMYPGDRFEPWDAVYRNAAMLDHAGIRFCIATGDASLAKNVGIEAGMAVAYGLHPDAGLRAITQSPAEILGIDDRRGSLEAGKAADLIVTNGSPLQASTQTLAVFIDGRPADLSNKHRALDTRFLKRPEPPLDESPRLRGPPIMHGPVLRSQSGVTRPARPADLPAS